jgi:site-specific recombinase XerC
VPGLLPGACPPSAGSASKASPQSWKRGGRARATVTRRLCTIAGSCKYAAGEELLEHSPAAHVRRPRAGCGSHAVALDRNELGALLAAAGPGPPAGHALISLPTLNGLRVPGAAGAGIEHPGLGRGHRTLTITRKGGKGRHDPAGAAHRPGNRPGPPASAPAGRSSWPRDGRRLDRHAAI